MKGFNRFKTWVLIAALGAVFIGIGSIWGRNGMIIALVIALVFNFAMYWFSDKIAVATSRAKPVTEEQYPELYRIVRELTQARGIPMPRIYVSDMMQPNAFATGRNEKHAAVCATKGILQICDEREMRGVLAHELSHVANHDILIGSVAAAIGMAITFIARMAFWGAMFGGDERDNAFGPFAMIIAWVLAPLAAAVIQMAVSRSREYQADESGAYLSHDPEALASALGKLEQASQQIPPPATLMPSEAHMFIVNPFRGRAARVNFANLFSTHPPTPARIARLEEIKAQIGTNPGQPLID